MPIKKSERGIIAIIAEMVREGETEANIIKNLMALGAREDEARRMVLIAQAQTYDLLKEEIGRIIESQISGNNPLLKTFLTNQITETAKKKMIMPETMPVAEPEKKEKKGFFSRLIEKLFGKKKTEEQEQGVGKLGSVSERISEAPMSLRETVKRMKNKIQELEEEQKEYRKKIGKLEKRSEEKELKPEEENAKKELEQKVQGYEMQIAALAKLIEGREELLEGRRKKIEKETGQKIAQGVVEEKQLRTMKQLAEASKAITLAAEKIVQTAPKPKIVLSGDEEMLSIDEQIEQLQNTKKRFEIDFYKRRITLQDFQEKSIDLQSQLYALEEKKKIMEKSSGKGGRKRQKQISPKLAGLLEKKLSKTLSNEKILEIENYMVDLLKHEKIPEQEVAAEVKSADSAEILSRLERLVKMRQLQQEAKKAVEEEGFKISPTIIMQPQAEQIQSRTMPETRSRQETLQSQETQTGFIGTGQGTGIPEQEAKKQGKGIKGFFGRKKQQAVQPQIIIMQQPAREKERIVRETIIEDKPRTEFAMGSSQPEKVYLKPVPETRFYRSPESEKRRVIVDAEKSWSEAEIPSYPSTAEKKEKEKIKTVLKEIQKYKIVTDLDLVYEIVRGMGIISETELQKATSVEKNRLENLIDILEDQKLLVREYPAFGEVKIRFASYVAPTREEKKTRQKEEKQKEKAKKEDKTEDNKKNEKLKNG